MYIANSQFASPSIGINSSAAKEAAIELRGAVKSFAPDKPAALKGISLDIAAGEMVALLGASGSGKSTLLRSLCGLELFNGKSESSVKIHGKILQASGKMSPQVRNIRKDMAIIFQQFNLVSRLNVLQNVMIGLTNRMPLWRSLSGRFSQQSVESAIEALKSVGLAELALQRASTLSGGQQQRVAIARALLQGPQILLADEPVASLDPESSERVMNLLAELQRKQNLTLIVSLHNVELARRYCQRIVVLRSGEVVFDGAATALSDQTLSGFYRPAANGDL